MGAKVEEQAGYFSVPGGHLYTVLNRVKQPVARVMLVGPFASERQFSYDHWVRWARYLAERNCEVLRFDYRGTGESTGKFQDSRFADWMEDVELLSEWFAGQSPDLPLLLHGLELGSIFSARRFLSGKADGLLMWSPVVNANRALQVILRRWATIEQLYDSPENRRSFSNLIRELELASGTVEVYGYQWTASLWRESRDLELPRQFAEQMHYVDDRPVKIVRLGSDTEMSALPFRRYEQGRGRESLYCSSYEWISREFLRC